MSEPKTTAQRDTEREIKQYEDLIKAENKASPLVAAKLAQARKRLAATQRKRSAFEQSYPEYSAEYQAREAASKKRLIYAGGAGVLGILGWFAWKKWKKR